MSNHPYSKRQEDWLRAAYTEFAKFGLESMNVDRLAGLVGKSRSSFYHLFGSMEQFKKYMFDLHKRETERYIEAQQTAERYYPDLADILVEFKDWTFFQMSLYRNREKCDDCRRLFKEVGPPSEVISATLWAKSAGLENLSLEQARELYHVVREAAFSKFRYDTFSTEQIMKALQTYNNSVKFLAT